MVTYKILPSLLIPLIPSSSFSLLQLFSLVEFYRHYSYGLMFGFQASEGEDVFAVAHIFASFNDTFVHITDLSGK